jgi:hypothetical protein
MSVQGDGSAGPVTLRELVAGNLRRLRTEAGVAPEDLLPTARANGLDWTASWLGSVERGTRSLSAEQLLALPVVLSGALRRRVTLADLLRGDRPVVLAGNLDPPHASVPAAYLRDVVTGEPVRRPFSTPVAAATPDPEAGAAARAAQRLREISRAGLGDVDIRALARAERGAGAAETRLARRLDVPEIAVIAAAASLWGHSLTEEQGARARAGEPATAVHRPLVADLTARVHQAASRAAEQRLAAMQAEVEAERAEVPPDAPPPEVEPAAAT